MSTKFNRYSLRSNPENVIFLYKLQESHLKLKENSIAKINMSNSNKYLLAHPIPKDTTPSKTALLF